MANENIKRYNVCENFLQLLPVVKGLTNLVTSLPGKNVKNFRLFSEEFSYLLIAWNTLFQQYTFFFSWCCISSLVVLLIQACTKIHGKTYAEG